MVHFIYTLLLLTGLLLSAPYYVLRSRRYAPTFKERLGFIAGPRLRRSIWVHAVSVGEVNAVQTLVERLRTKYPDRALVFSATTPAGQELARNKIVADRVFYFPFDLPWAVRRALDHFDPEVVVIAETEIWPNFVRACRERGVKLMMVNGRIADRSLARYRRVRRWLKGVLAGYSVLGMQSRLDSERIREIGGDPGKVTVFGNLKYDIPARSPAIEPALAALLQAQQPLWIAASTAPGEEEMILDAFAALRKRDPKLRLLIAPRKPERFDEVATKIQGRGYACLRRSRIGTTTGTSDAVLLLDTIGELAGVLAHASVVFMGGTLAPIGGHNILEAARFSKPIVYGPHMENNREMSELFLKAQAAIQIAGPAELPGTVEELLERQDRAATLGQNAKRIVDEHAGATDRFIAYLDSEFR
jgi:3-deoxy-D-manno-octulosonic-acid transferase